MGDLSSTRRGAAAFLDNLPVDDPHAAIGQQNWITRWTKIGDEYCLLGDLNIKKGAFDEATDAWLCALTAFETARRLVDQDDPRSVDVLAKVDGGIQRFELSLAQKIERVKITCCDHAELSAYYLPAGSPDLPASAVICISMEQETGATLLGRLLPVVIGRGMSLLVITHDDVSSHSRGKSEALLSFCLDYLSARRDVDDTRIGVYGEAFSAVLATEFAVSDGRLAAAVCDGGLWNWARIVASVDWLTRTANIALENDAISARRLQFIRQLRCPVLVVAGGRGIVSVSEATKLQAYCMAARIDLELALPRMIRSPGRGIENFVTSDDCIFGWLEHKLALNSHQYVVGQDNQIT
ncbi:hypothetical protein JJB99_31680 [Bradyrhizobium diazoefficiens]|uniref:alpha/beta hydrolase family protein n=1 Tax=Bradyrhizobium diazoefficiens TaxID=1355477 RepID=UPI00190B33EB|nr:hypothetical protein [Bradyrhizobium diazoefficiens]QQO13870.1 hypothetical protein JJB99_31680 [Bradyrhizobium diazoefficiens]